MVMIQSATQMTKCPYITSCVELERNPWCSQYSCLAANFHGLWFWSRNDLVYTNTYWWITQSNWLWQKTNLEWKYKVSGTKTETVIKCTFIPKSFLRNY